MKRILFMKFYLILITVPVLLSSCLKQSIADAMLNSNNKSQVTATLSYEIDGNLQTTVVNDADHQQINGFILYCQPANGYVLNCAKNDFMFKFYTNTLSVGNYKYSGNGGLNYVLTYDGTPGYLYAASDYIDANITSYKDGHISGNFSGQITPASYNGGFGASSSIIIKNGIFTNVPVYQ